MPIYPVMTPTKGIVTAIPPTDLDNEQSPYMAGVYLKDGEIVSDYGHTPFPAPGALKTNQLNGVFMRSDKFLLSSGVTRLVAHTTTNAYEYNTSTNTWDCITKGQTIDGGETAWTASANVTSTRDTAVKLRGTYSAKHVIAAGFTTGLASYFDISSLDLTLETGIHYWIYSTTATTAGDLQILLDNTAACASPLELLDVPALVANTWTPVYVPYASAAALGAIISVGLKVIVDRGAQTVYLDDIRSVDAFTGTASNLFSVAFFTTSDAMLVTNGVNQPKKYLGTAATGEVNHATALAAGTISTSEIVLVAKDHVIYFNNTENGADAPQRASWGNIGQLEDFVGGTAGYQDLTDDSSWVITVEQLSENRWAVYKETQIVVMDWVGGQTPFRFTTMVRGTNIAGKASVKSVYGVHYVCGIRDIYTYAGGAEFTPIDGFLKRSLFNLIDFTYILRAFIIYIEADDEVQFWLPTTTAYPDTVYCYDTTLKVWYNKTRTMTGTGLYATASALTIADLTGTIGQQNFTFGSTVTKSNTPIYLVGDSTGAVFYLDKSTLNNNGVAITNEWQSRDFILPQKQAASSSLAAILGAQTPPSQAEFFRVQGIDIEAKGQSVTLEYSTDGGASWNPCQGAGTNTETLTGSYAIYCEDFDVVCRKIRFRFRNTTVSSGFAVRFFSFDWKPRSTRR